MNNWTVLNGNNHNRDSRWNLWRNEKRKYWLGAIYKKDNYNSIKKIKKLNELLKNSEVSDEDVLNIGRKIKREIAKRHGLWKL